MTTQSNRTARPDNHRPRPRLRPGWLLWADWCHATGHSGLVLEEATLDRFQAAVPRARLSDLRRTARDVGLPWPGEPGPPDPWLAVEAGGLPSLDAALRGCPRSGWPDGYRGRRDAWLLLLTRGLRMTRTQVVQLRGCDIDHEGSRHDRTGRGSRPLVVGGHQLGAATCTAVCPSCVAARWLRCIEQEHRWGRSAVRELLLQVPGAAPTEHDHNAPQLPGFAVLAPAIDRHGWATDWRPMTTRAVTSVLAARHAPDQLASPSVAAGITPQATSELSRPFDRTTFDRMDAACRRADEVNQRIAALLDDTASALRRRTPSGRPWSSG